MGLPSPLLQTSAVPLPQLFCSHPASKLSCISYRQGSVSVPVSDSFLDFSFPFTPLSRLLFPKVNRCLFSLGTILTAQFHIELCRAYGKDEINCGSILRFSEKCRPSCCIHKPFNTEVLHYSHLAALQDHTKWCHSTFSLLFQRILKDGLGTAAAPFLQLAFKLNYFFQSSG